MKEELQNLRDKVKHLNKKVKTSKKNQSKDGRHTNSIMNNPNCDYELCMEEDDNEQKFENYLEPTQKQKSI